MLVEHGKLRKFSAANVAFEQDIILLVSGRAVRSQMLLEEGFADTLTTFMTIDLLAAIVTLLVLVVVSLGIKALAAIFELATICRWEVSVHMVVLHLCVA